MLNLSSLIYHLIDLRKVQSCDLAFMRFNIIYLMEVLEIVFGELVESQISHHVSCCKLVALMVPGKDSDFAVLAC